MRIRTVKPEFWTHPVMARLEPPTQLLALALLNYADDEGYFRAEAELVRAACAPFTEDSRNVHGMLQTLLKVGWIEVCETEKSGVIGRIAKWDKHQRVNKPSASKLRTYWVTEDSRNVHGTITERCREEQGTGNREHIPPIVPLAGDEEGDVSGDPLTRAKGIFRMRAGTRLDAGQERAWRKARAVVEATTEAEWALMEGYYSADLRRKDDFRRRDLATLLNNWQGELTRAASWARQTGFEPQVKKEKGWPEERIWRAALAELYPDGDAGVFGSWADVPESLKAEVLAVLRAADDLRSGLNTEGGSR